MNINCKERAKDYLINNNIAYRLRFPISLLIAIIVSVSMKYAYKINNFFIAHLLIPLAVFFVILFIIDVCVKHTISRKKLEQIENECNGVMNYEKFENSDVEESTYDNSDVENSTYDNSDIENNVKNVTDFISIDKHPHKIMKKYKHSNRINSDASSIDEKKYATINANPSTYQYSEFPLGNSYPTNHSIMNSSGHPSGTGCLTGTNPCTPLCSGTGINKCNIVAPVPGPQWQVQSASTVQNRLENGHYVKDKCPVGGVILRDTDNCNNLTEKNIGDCAETNVKCKNALMYA